MPVPSMPEYTGWNQEVLKAQQQRSGIDNTLTNTMIQQQMAPVNMDLHRAQAEYARAHAGQAKAAVEKEQMMRELIGALGPDPDPDVLINLGVRLNHPAWITEGERKKAQKAQAGGLASLQSQPGPQNDMSRPMTESQVPTNEWADYVKVRDAQGPMTTAPGNPQARYGGALRPQMQSPNTGIAQQATQVQGQVDALRPGAMPLASVEGMVNRVTSADQALGNRAPPRPETPVAVIGPDGKARYVPASEAYGQTPASQANQGDSVNPDNAHLTGEEYIATLPPGMRNLVKGLITYKLPLNQLSNRSGERKAAFEHAAQADPNFNVAKYQQRQKVMNDFTSGKVADNLTALGQAVNHMNTMKELSDALKNGNVQVINQVVNTVRRQLGDPSITNYETAQSAVGTELMRVFRQVNASEVETKDWISKFPTKGSPQQIEGALATGAKLLKGRMEELNHRWNKGMDVDTGYKGLMSPTAQASFEKLVGSTGIASPSGGVEYNGYHFPSQDALDKYKAAVGANG